MCGLGPCVSIDWAGSRMESRGGIDANDDMTLQRVRRSHFLSDNSATNCREHVTTHRQCIDIDRHSVCCIRQMAMASYESKSIAMRFCCVQRTGVLHLNRRASPFGFCFIQRIDVFTNHKTAQIGLLLQLIATNYYIPGTWYNAPPFGLLQADCYSFNTGTNNNA